jgi:hypothetical protein
MPIHNRHDFQAFTTFRRADLRATAFGQRKGCVDEALFFIEHTSFAKLIGDVGQNTPQHFVATPTLKTAMNRFVVWIAPRQHVPLRAGVQ